MAEEVAATSKEQLQTFDKVTEWEISDQESCSDHNIIKYIIGNRTALQTDDGKLHYNHSEPRYVINEQNYNRFDKNLKELIARTFRMENQEDSATMDSNLVAHNKDTNDIENAVEKLQEAIKSSCNISFRIRGKNKTTNRKSVPWWTEELTIKRKRLNALRRQYQRMKNNEQLREDRKHKFSEERAKYQATIKKEKLNSWKEYCDLTSGNNPWNAIYKPAKNKTKKTQCWQPFENLMEHSQPISTEL